MADAIGQRDYPDLSRLGLPTPLVKAITRVYQLVYDLRDAVVGQKIYSVAYQSAAQSLANGAVATKLSFDTNVFSPDPIHAPATGDFIAPVAGLYLANAGLSWVNDTTGTYRSLFGEINGTVPKPLPIVTTVPSTGGTHPVELNVSFTVFLKQGDVVQFMAIHDATGALNTVPAHTRGSLTLLNKTTS